MKSAQSDFISLIGAGVAAGLVGTGVMIALRSFDQRYAPKTLAKTKEDPGAFMVHAAERATGTSRVMPRPVEQSAALATHMVYGTMFGILYGLWRGRGKHRSALSDGIPLGAAVYGVGHLGWLPVLGLARPIWKQRFPEVAGELTRHIFYGVATTAVYGTIDAVMSKGVNQ